MVGISSNCFLFTFDNAIVEVEAISTIALENLYIDEIPKIFADPSGLLPTPRAPRHGEVDLDPGKNRGRSDS